jgi:hypothetical protein
MSTPPIRRCQSTIPFRNIVGSGGSLPTPPGWTTNSDRQPDMWIESSAAGRRIFRFLITKFEPVINLKTAKAR